MNTETCNQIVLASHRLTPLPSGALFWADEKLLCVSDLHLGKSERIARRNGTLVPPYDIEDTLLRLEGDIQRTGARTVICLGDSFDDISAAEALEEVHSLWISRLQAGRNWIWIEGNHDPGPMPFSGSHLAETTVSGLHFRHIAKDGETPEVSGHYHPKAEILARGRLVSRRCFIWDARRLILPSYGTYTGGLRWTDPALQSQFGPHARAALVGDPIHIVPLPATSEEDEPEYGTKASR